MKEVQVNNCLEKLAKEREIHINGMKLAIDTATRKKNITDTTCNKK